MNPQYNLQQQQQQYQQQQPDYTAIGGDKIAGFINSFDWFKYIVGYDEETYKKIRDSSDKDPSITKGSDGNFYISNGSKEFCAGNFKLKSVGEMFSEFNSATPTDTTSMHDKVTLNIYFPAPGSDMTEFFLKLGVSGLQVFAETDTTGTKKPKSMFQVASNFNGIEAVEESAPPESEEFTTNYIYDQTQGPGASVSAGPAAIARVYAAFYNEGKRPYEWSQRGENQIKMLEDVSDYYRVTNGYVVNSENNVDLTKHHITEGDDTTINEVAKKVKLCVHTNVDVVFGARYYNDDDDDVMAVLKDPHRINQVFTAAMNLHQGPNGKANQILPDSPAKSRALLRAAYMGTYLSAINTGCEVLYLTLIGGGAFGNSIKIIFDEILNAHKMIAMNEKNRCLKCVKLWLFKSTKEMQDFVKTLEEERINFVLSSIKC